MSIGLSALLDDIAALAKAAAASIDDVAAQATKAGTKAAGVVIDDTAVTPRYVTGFSPARELPIIWKITLGSFRNKLVILLPALLALSAFFPQIITPMLMVGGLYLCFEGAEKIIAILFPGHAHEEAAMPSAADAKAFEAQTVSGAIRTDFILSAEIMTITLGNVAESSLPAKAAVLAIVGIAITIGVYGVVALIVKADDFGLMLARRKPLTFLGRIAAVFGRGLVHAMPYLLNLLGWIGTVAMVWVGGGIFLHGLDHYGFVWLSENLEHVAELAAQALPAVASVVNWLVEAVGSAIFGLLVGAVAAVIYGFVAPLFKRDESPEHG